MISKPVWSIVLLCWAFLTAHASGSSVRFENPKVKDVPAAFARIGGTASRLGLWTQGVIDYPFYSLNPDHDFGDNHFQGIQRLRHGNFVVISGSNIAREGDLTRYGLPQPDALKTMEPAHGDLFVGRLESRPSQGAWGSSLDSGSSQPDAKDRLVLDIKVAIPLPTGTTLWHPGGIGVSGDVLVVPVENYNAKFGELASQVLFYDVSDPEHPRQFSRRIDRTEEPVKEKAGNATMTRLRDGHFLVEMLNTDRLSFYLSRTKDFADGFDSRPTAVLDKREVHETTGLKHVNFAGSSAQFVQQEDGTLFLISFKSYRADSSPVSGGAEVASLWRVEFPGGDYHATPVITRIADRAFDSDSVGEDLWGSVGAAAGIYVTDDGAIAVYATARWQTDRPGRHPTRDTLKTGDYVHPGDHTFIPMVELWPR